MLGLSDGLKLSDKLGEYDGLGLALGDKLGDLLGE